MLAKKHASKSDLDRIAKLCDEDIDYSDILSSQTKSSPSRLLHGRPGRTASPSHRPCSASGPGAGTTR
jgi:hypothetical protein